MPKQNCVSPSTVFINESREGQNELTIKVHDQTKKHLHLITYLNGVPVADIKSLSTEPYDEKTNLVTMTFVAKTKLQDTLKPKTGE